MAAESENIERFTGPIGFEAYAGHMSTDQGLSLEHALRQIPGVERISESPKTNKHNGLILRVFVLSAFDSRIVQRNVADKVAELSQAWGIRPMPVTVKF